MPTQPPALSFWTAPDKLDYLRGLARDGYTDKEIAEKMGVRPQTLQSYRAKSPELDAAIREAKEVVDYRVEAALLKAATGGTVTESKVMLMYKEGKLIQTVRERTVRDQPPNVLACQTWLYNRQREKWKRNRDHEITVEEDKSINITIKRAGGEE